MGNNLPSPTGSYACVVIGETGSGKTSFLNLIANLKTVLELGKERELTLEHVRHLHREAQTENASAAKSQSQTKAAYPHHIEHSGMALTLIDTPGYGDTDGLEADQQNAASIQHAIEAQDAIHCVVLLINGRLTRISPQIRYVLKGLCSVLPQRILKQVVVVFTQVKDPDDDLQFDPHELTEFLGTEVPLSHQLCIDNPYARIARLMEKGSSKDPAKKLRLIKNEFAEVANDLIKLLETISSFQPVETVTFGKLNTVKRQLTKSVRTLCHKLESLTLERSVEEKLGQELQQLQISLNAVKDFQTSAHEERWQLERTKGRRHMVCKLCQSNCHIDCELNGAADSLMALKECRCFHWYTQKFLSIQTESDRKQLLQNIVDCQVRGVCVESGRRGTIEYKIASSRNFTINGVHVRGNPTRQWLSSRYFPYAVSTDATVTQIRLRPLPFTLCMSDWSNTEQGSEMICKACGHSLKHHMSETGFYKKVFAESTSVDQAKRKRLRELTAILEENKIRACAAKESIAKLEEAEQREKKELLQRLHSLQQLAATSSYLAALSEVRDYLVACKARAIRESNAKFAKALEELLEMLASKEFAGLQISEQR